MTARGGDHGGGSRTSRRCARLWTRVVLCALIVVVAPTVVVWAKVDEMECQADGTCQKNNDDDDDATIATAASSSRLTSQSLSGDDGECSLYMAPSAIPGAGWGVYTAKALPKNHTLNLKEVVIQYIDAKRHYGLQKLLHNTTTNTTNQNSAIVRNDPLLANYVTSAIDSMGMFDASDVTSVTPGISALLNGHLGLYNVGPATCASRGSGPRTSPSAGASSAYQKCQVTTTTEVPAGHELFADYGDDWFLARTDQFGYNVPLKQDYMGILNTIYLWREQFDQTDGDGDTMHALWETKYEEVRTLMTKGQRRLFPKSAIEALTVTGDRFNVGYLEFPNVVRPLDWFALNGICLDHVGSKLLDTSSSSSLRKTERTAVTRRSWTAGSVVIHTPLVHLSRAQLDMIYMDGKPTDKPLTALWQGQQLLLNYCYGHPSSSVLFFPYGPSVNLINHPGPGQTANVAVRWSSKMSNPEWLELNATALLTGHQNQTGLMMEYYALTDITKGEELLLDYGTKWQTAWDRHVEDWSRQKEQQQRENLDMTFLNNYVSAFVYAEDCDTKIETTESYNCLYHPPTWIETRCWIHPDKLRIPSDGNTTAQVAWVAPRTMNDAAKISIDGTHKCHVRAIHEDGLYSVRLHYRPKKRKKVYAIFTMVMVPREAIFFVDQAYNTNQLLRSAFRHEIQLPDDMVPAPWKDLEPEPHSNCGLYMAESAIPHSGLGMYTTNSISKGKRILYGDVVVQVEDMDVNTKLRNWSNKKFDYDENDWLLNNYYWNPRNSMGNFDAASVQSVIPGLGMLANSHTGLMNSDIKAPQRLAGLHRGKDSGTGGSTTYHDVHFTAMVDIEAGAELFVEYGDSWFEDRESTMGLIPLSDDFEDADKSLKKLVKVVEKTNTKRNDEMVLDALRLLGNMTTQRPRMANAIPKDIEGLERAVVEGTASLSVPNRIRSAKWLEENGRCLDNIRPDVSTVRQAGRGAFATRVIKKGDVISPMPLVHVRRRHMAIYGGDDYDDKSTNVWPDGVQLLLNYCYSHPESSILLFPYAPVVNYVNHQSAESGKVNAEVRWSSLPNHHNEWLERTPDDLDKEDHAGLIMEMVATRDISAGEEVFLFYGTAWDSAWSAFVQKWKPTAEDMSYVSTAELNERVEWIRTVDELKTHPYPFSNHEDIFHLCFVGSLDGLFVDGKSVTIPWTGAEDLFDTSNDAYPCQVLQRKFDEGKYSMEEVYDRSYTASPVNVKYTIRLQTKKGRSVTVDDVPRKAIQFFDTKYMSDNFLRTAFRHEMHLPDEMIPTAWKDLKS